tara:strand:- start:2351 stop:2920 length:570 start_codon:yes stop_codon:yes gene_type:complete
MQRVIGAYPEAEFGKVSSAYGDGTRSAEAFNQRSVGWGDELSERRKALGSGSAGNVHVFLDCARHTVEGTQFFTSGYGGVSVDCRGSSLLGQNTGDGVQPAIHFVDAIQMGVDHLEARHLASSDHLGQIVGGSLPEAFNHFSNLNNFKMVTELVTSPGFHFLPSGRSDLGALGTYPRGCAGQLGGHLLG